MEVRLFPNSRRPGVGQRPRREGQRPLLPQHARHCPVLEAGSALGFLVYPPLEPNESYHVEFQGDGKYQFTYFLSNPRGKWDAIFSVTTVLPVGTLGMIKEEVAFMSPNPSMTRDDATLVIRPVGLPADTAMGMLPLPPPGIASTALFAGLLMETVGGVPIGGGEPALEERNRQRALPALRYCDYRCGAGGGMT